MAPCNLDQTIFSLASAVNAAAAAVFVDIVAAKFTIRPMAIRLWFTDLKFWLFHRNWYTSRYNKHWNHHTLLKMSIFIISDLLVFPFFLFRNVRHRCGFNISNVTRQLNVDILFSLDQTRPDQTKPCNRVSFDDKMSSCIFRRFNSLHFPFEYEIKQF